MIDLNHVIEQAAHSYLAQNLSVPIPAEKLTFEEGRDKRRSLHEQQFIDPKFLQRGQDPKEPEEDFLSYENNINSQYPIEPLNELVEQQFIVPNVLQGAQNAKCTFCASFGRRRNGEHPCSQCKLAGSQCAYPDINTSSFSTTNNHQDHDNDTRGRSREFLVM
ncbi:uncharacterized protein PAC_09887 [Phialocephala subalpina]|uniref:Zn(2)-C6 fungal-type domain-containing protein n=1 Tax=Phialocephala subalpina TaxID=576137 RepID=A0A1L7X4Q8_9HELO|nr:uncharacterized protein PAC_09887 [Phialocephala subalpina]